MWLKTVDVGSSVTTSNVWASIIATAATTKTNSVALPHALLIKDHLSSYAQTKGCCDSRRSGSMFSWRSYQHWAALDPRDYSRSWLFLLERLRIAGAVTHTKAHRHLLPNDLRKVWARVHGIFLRCFLLIYINKGLPMGIARYAHITKHCCCVPDARHYWLHFDPAIMDNAG